MVLMFFEYFRHFRGSFKGENFNSDFPPPRVFKNNVACKSFTTFISKTILERISSGAVSVWGKVGETPPPHLVMPLTVEPSKPRLCNDDRFLNLWMVDRPFHLDRLPVLPRYVHQNSFQSVTDDKSGYDHLLLTPESRTYFGFRWGRWYFVSNTIPFGWKLSAFVYHTTGSMVSHYLRSIGIPCSLYIDDRHIGQLIPPSSSPSSSDLELAMSAVFLACFTLVSLGYFIGLNKCVLVPRQQVPYLGFISDSCKQAFTLLPKKKQKFLALVRDILQNDSIEVVTLQKLAGKCNSMSLAIPGARLFTNEMNLAIAKGCRSSRPQKLSPALRAEISHWLFLESWEGYLPWISERHSHIKLYTDASPFGWGGLLSPDAISVTVSDYWSTSTIPLDITTKEALALANVLKCFSESISNSWVDVYTDSKILLHTWEKQGSRSRPLFEALKSIFKETLSANILLNLHHIPSGNSLADSASRQLNPADSCLSLPFWQRIQEAYGGELGHSVDLTALPSNVRPNPDGFLLPFFSPFPTPSCTGVNVFAQTPANHRTGLFDNPYAFPPIILIGHLLRYLTTLSLPCTLVVPDVFPRRYWWPILCSKAASSFRLARKGDFGVLLTPTKSGYQPLSTLPWDLWVFRV